MGDKGTLWPNFKKECHGDSPGFYELLLILVKGCIKTYRLRSIILKLYNHIFIKKYYNIDLR